MIIIISTPLRIAASYALVFAAGTVITRIMRIGRSSVQSQAATSSSGR
jgi:hypothetical protein